MNRQRGDIGFERRSRVLVDAAFIGDRRAAEKWDVSERTVRNYWKLLETNAAFAAFFRINLEKRTNEWADAMTPAILDAVDYIHRAVGAMDEANPEALEAVVGALRTLAEIQITKEMLDVRLADSDRAQNAAHGSHHGHGRQPKALA